MFEPNGAFSGFSVKSLSETKQFFEEVLGITVTKAGAGLELHLPGGDTTVFVYPKGAGHTPATYTNLNFEVKNIDAAVTELKKRGVTFEQYANCDETGVMRGISHNMGPDIAWFKDPSGNILAVLQNPSTTAES